MPGSGGALSLNCAWLAIPCKIGARMVSVRGTAAISSIALSVLGSLFGIQALAAAPDVTELIKQGRQLSMAGDQRGALAQFQKALQQSPDLFEAQWGMGTTLDLLGKYAEAQRHIRKMIELAPNPDAKTQAARAMVVSYAFERKPAGAAKYEKQIFDSHLAAHNFAGAAETADELARIYLECGNLDQAYDWYQKGYNTALKKPDISAQEKDLWGFRWDAGQARVAARRGETQIAEKELAAARAFLDRLHNPQQEAFFPYLIAYIHFYAGNYAAAITDLEKANQKDPFVLELLARAYEKSGQRSKAEDTCGAILKFSMHNIANAFARPSARQMLRRKRG